MCYPNPVCEDYGFKFRAEKKKKGRGTQEAGKASKQAKLSAVQWLDEGSESSGDESDAE